MKQASCVASVSFEDIFLKLVVLSILYSVYKGRTKWYVFESPMCEQEK